MPKYLFQAARPEREESAFDHVRQSETRCALSQGRLFSRRRVLQHPASSPPRTMSRNNIRGPTSALTDFLRVRPSHTYAVGRADSRNA
jgi:hypothetical protein